MQSIDFIYTFACSNKQGVQQMAIFHLAAKFIKRSDGRSAVSASAYRAAEKLHDAQIDKSFDYTKKKHVYETCIIPPANTPSSLLDRQALWNAAEEAETRSNSQTAREIEISLFVELSPTQNLKLAKAFVQKHFADKGIISDVALHNMESGNPHAHILTATRSMTSDGFGKKDRDIVSKQALNELRQDWAVMANAALEKHGFEERIDHRSHKDRGIEAIPQIHIGSASMRMKSRGEKSYRWNRNELIKAANNGTLTKSISTLQRQLNALKEERDKRLGLEGFDDVFDDLDHQIKNIKNTSKEEHKKLIEELTELSNSLEIEDPDAPNKSPDKPAYKKLKRNKSKEKKDTSQSKHNVRDDNLTNSKGS